VDDNIQLAELFNRRRNRAFHFLKVTHVCGTSDGFASTRANLLDRMLKMLHFATDQSNTRDAIRERTRHAASDSRSTARHQSDVAGEQIINENFIAHFSRPFSRSFSLMRTLALVQKSTSKSRSLQLLSIVELTD